MLTRGTGEKWQLIKTLSPVLNANICYYTGTAYSFYVSGLMTIHLDIPSCTEALNRAEGKKSHVTVAKQQRLNHPDHVPLSCKNELLRGDTIPQKWIRIYLYRIM